MKPNTPRFQIRHIRKDDSYAITSDIVYTRHGTQEWKEYSARFDTKPSNHEVLDFVNSALKALC